jgi:hypothetical protein
VDGHPARCDRASCPGFCSQSPSPRRFCRHRLTETFGARPEPVLEGLVRLGRVVSWKAIGEVIFVEWAEAAPERERNGDWRPLSYSSDRERVEVAAEAALEAEPGTRDHRTAWRRLRDACRIWLDHTPPKGSTRKQHARRAVLSAS